jgi:hypothetical protein
VYPNQVSKKTGCPIEAGSLLSLYEFENQGFFGAGQGHMVRFALVTLVGRGQKSLTADFFFQGKAIEELSDSIRRFSLSASDISLLNPNTRTCPIFRTRRDAAITKSIYARIPVAIDETQPNGNSWGLRFATMFHMSNDSSLFRTSQQLSNDGWELRSNRYFKGEQECLPLYEAKLIYQFDHRYGDYGLLAPGAKGHVLPSPPGRYLDDPWYAPLPRYWVRAEDVLKKAAGFPHLRWDAGLAGCD